MALTIGFLGKFDIFSAKGLVLAEMIPVQEGDGEVDEDLVALARVSPDEEDAQALLVPRKGQRPTVITVTEMNRIGIDWRHSYRKQHRKIMSVESLCFGRERSRHVMDDFTM